MARKFWGEAFKTVTFDGNAEAIVEGEEIGWSVKPDEEIGLDEWGYVITIKDGGTSGNLDIIIPRSQLVAMLAEVDDRIAQGDDL